jgi:hypothetical protein
VGADRIRDLVSPAAAKGIADILIVAAKSPLQRAPSVNFVFSIF